MVQKKFTYVVRPLDVDGDGIPDGDLIEKVNIKTGEVVSRKFVTSAKSKKIVNSLPRAPVPKTQKQRVVYKDSQINRMEQQQQQPIMVADQTTFGQSLKTGFATGLGREAASSLFDAVGGLFE